MRKARPLTEIEKDALKMRLRNTLINACNKVPRQAGWTGNHYLFKFIELEQLVVDASLCTAEFLLEIRREKGEVE